MKNLLLDKRNLLTIFVLLLATIVLNGLIFSKQLNYGFRDVDWQVLYYFKLFGNLSLNHLLQEIKVLGVYIPESYYVGLLQKFLGINFVSLHQVTHLFKIIVAISVYALVVKIFKRKLLAFVSSLIYTISYTHAGALFQLSSGGYFLATIFMNLFLIAYYDSLKRVSILKWSILVSFLLILSLALKPERMYPLIALIILVELFIIVSGGFRKNVLLISLKRTLIILLPLIVFFPFFHALFTDGVFPGFAPSQFFLGAEVKVESILKGNLQILIDPFVSLGSIFLYDDYWKLLGPLNFQDFGVYIFSLILGPIIRLGFITFILCAVFFKRSLKLVLLIMIPVLIFGLIIYGLNINWQQIESSARIHFDPNITAVPAITGFYIFILNLIFFVMWLKGKDSRFAPLFTGIAFASLFILMTWISSDILLVFMGPQRYLSIPSIGTSLFVSALLVIIYDRIKSTKSARNFAGVIFLLLIPLIVVNYQVVSKFFDYELTYAGLRASEQTRMKDKFRQLTGKISTTDKSLFYFDETADKQNGYFDEGTVMAGFNYWTRVNMDGSLNNFPDPGMMRTNLQCPEHTHQNCVDILKAGLGMEGGQYGIWYKDPIRGNRNNFYKISNFHAYRFVNRDIVDIREEVLKELGL